METRQSAHQDGTFSTEPPPVAPVAAPTLATRESQAMAPVPAASADLERMVEFESRKKSMAMAYVLWWLTGAFGGHRFYMGRTGSATAMLIISLVSIPLMVVLIGFITIFVPAVWALVDAFLIPGWIREHNAGVARSLGVQIPLSGS